MALGPGKYDDLCTVAQQTTGAHGCVLIIVNGSMGTGFSCQATPEITLRLPELLRATADEIEATLKKGKL